jgi:heat shock protein HtpX
MIFNKIKTAVLLAALSGILLFFGSLFGGAAGLQFALILALIMNGIAYFFSDKIVLSLYNAKPLDQQEYAWIYEIIEELRHSMQLPMPKLWLVQTPMANAFATGRNPNHASIAVTTGILNLLDRDELRGVLAHELSHVKNRDILVGTVAATIATAIGYLANMLQHMAFWDSISGSERRRAGNPLVALAISIVMPIAAMLIQFAISRSREYLADETGARHCHDPLALASALEKLHNHIPHAHLHNNDARRASTAPLFIVHPFTSSNWMSLFSTHPPMQKRIQRLRALCQKMY